MHYTMRCEECQKLHKQHSLPYKEYFYYVGDIICEVMIV